MNHKHALTLIMALALGAAAFSCADSESRMPLGGATAVISLAHTESPLESIVPSEPRYAGTPAPPPAAFDRVLVKVSGPDIGTIEKNFPYSDTISMEVPAGALRRFEVTAFVAAWDWDNSMTWSAASTFKGVATTNAPAGATVSVPVYMIMDESRFLIPDYNNGRIVQFSTIPTALTTWWQAISPSPYDLDFDARGRIYVLNKGVFGGYDMIYRHDNIMNFSGPLYEAQVLSDSMLNVTAFTVDRRRNLLYYISNNTQLVRVDLTQTMPISAVTYLNNYDPDTMSSYFNSMKALDVGDDGILTIIGEDYSYAPIMRRYNPLAVKFDGETTYRGLAVGAPFEFRNISSYPLDVQVRSQDVCVLNMYRRPNYAVMQFQATPLGFILGAHFGTAPPYIDMPVGQGTFYRPQHFAIRRENMLVIMDEGYDDYLMTPVHRLVFTDFDLSRPWNTFGTYGSGDGQFNFFSYC